MTANMGLIVKHSFVKAVRVIDRFHVQKPTTEAIQEIRRKHRGMLLTRKMTLFSTHVKKA